MSLPVEHQLHRELDKMFGPRRQTGGVTRCFAAQKGIALL